MQEIKIGNKTIGSGHPAYIIAEIGLNHQGDVRLAKKLIDIAVDAGADAVKFQKRSLRHIYRKDVLEHADREEHATHYSFEHIKKNELNERKMASLCRYSRAKGIDFLCTPWDESSLRFLKTLNLSAYKIASADMSNTKLLRAVAALKRPMLISTGMSFVSEIEQLVSFLGNVDTNPRYVLLHCNSAYPAPYHDINLNFTKTLRDRFQCLVGYSGHERGISVSLAAVAMGACLIERHLTLDQNMEGPDHRASLEPDEFRALVREIRIVEKALGDSIRFPSRGEYLNRETLAKSLVAAHDLKKGTVLSHADIAAKTPGKGTSPLKIDQFVGRKLLDSLKEDDFILESHVGLMKLPEYARVKLNHPWGIVARMHDIDTFMHWKSDFVEIHLTDSDINNDKQYSKKYNINLAIHGPEYNGDLLLDLSSLDGGVRNKSIEFFNKALNHSRKLKKFFRNSGERVKFVIHPGGMNRDAALLDKITKLNSNLADSLSKLNGEGFELLVENMPGHPWFFGGQWYHGSFMDADEIVRFSRKTGYGITFDTSHAALYCNLYRKDLGEFTKKIIPVTKYIHISDAAKTNGEGLQIGDGNVDFKPILANIEKKNIWILPEIWQGHKFGGHRFIEALSKLKEINKKL
ncbi:MAG: N-acetylneuraminate synthase family protein [Candidatus Yanofskybacteria bacterium]|nr:N-acetylneuraminate synthase family protein [Candidatus Yanofskybacteria bacterium]